MGANQVTFSGSPIREKKKKEKLNPKEENLEIKSDLCINKIYHDYYVLLFFILEKYKRDAPYI